jgi:hypothetical protein
MRCIYCKCDDPQKFRSVEHVLPHSFGTFGTETPTLKGAVCDDCNQFFKRDLDQVFARESLEGLTRYKKGILSSEARPQQLLKIAIPNKPSMGPAAGVLVWIDGTTGKISAPFGQVHFPHEATGEYRVVLKADLLKFDWRSGGYSDRSLKVFCRDADEHDEIVRVLKADLLKFDWRSGGYSDRSLKVFCRDADEHDEIVQLLGQIGIDFKPHAPIDDPSKMHADADGAMELEIEGTIDHTIKRALVKILMNFAARYIGIDEVLRPEWDKARNYARFGTDPLPARTSGRPFWGEESLHWRLEDDSYNLRIEIVGNDVVGAIQLFNLNTYEFKLIEGYDFPLQKEVAARFTPGLRPHFGEKRCSA